MWSSWIMSMRRWFSKFSTSSLASTSRATSPSPTTTNISEQIRGQSESPIPSPPASFQNNDLNTFWNVDFASDPCSWESSFDNHWDKVNHLIEDKENIDYRKMITVFHHLGSMIQLLMMEANAQPESTIGPILDRHFTYQIMERVVDWAVDAPHFLAPICQANLIRLYEIIVGESHTQNHCLLVHKPMLLPLFKLLTWCRRSAEKRNFAPSNTDKHFVLLLNQICTKMAEDATLLHFFFTFSSEYEEQFLVFSFLIPYLYDSGDVGQLARDALLLILSVSRRLEHIAVFIANKSNFCPVVATGLSGCFSQLSRTIGSVLYASDDWHKINVEDMETCPSLLDFYSSLLFCNAVVQVAHECVVSQLITYIYHGFLLPVALPSLLQGGQDELISSTAYYHLCLDCVSEPDLLQIFVKLLVTEECEDNKKVIDAMVERISAGNRLSQVSLSLLRSLIDLRCEDVMFALFFKYLVPCTHLQSNQISLLNNQKYVRPAAQSLLSLIPECTYKSSALCSQGSLQSYMAECKEYVQLTTDACYDTWAWSYDGKNPTPSVRSSSDEESSASCNGQAFIRNSSVRSSMVSTKNGLNRYFVNRMVHITAESLRQDAPLPELGACGTPPKTFLPFDIHCSSPIADDDIDLIVPPITPHSIMMISTSDYFQFAYGELSETDNEAVMPQRAGNGPKKSPVSIERRYSSTNASLSCDTDNEMARSFVLRGWGQVEDMNTFMTLLDRVPTSKLKHSLDENLALIDSRIQYLDEMSAEILETKAENNESREAEENMKKRNDGHVPLGQSIEFVESRGVGPFLDALLRTLENMLDNSLYVNLHTTSALAAVASYPQPLIAHYLFDQRMSVQPGVKSLFKVLDTLKIKIDAYASTLDGFDMLLERGIRFLRSRAERYEKALESSRLYMSQLYSRDGRWHNGQAILESSESSKGIFRKFRSLNRSSRRQDKSDASHPHEFRFYSHKAMESRDVTLDHARAKQVVFAAIILSQLCQQLAATVLQHSVVVPRPKSSLRNS